MINIDTIELTAKIQLYPNNNQKQKLLKSMLIYKDSCNFLSNRVFEEQDFNQVSLHYKYYDYMRNEFGIPSQMSSSVIKTVLARYKSIKNNSNNNYYSLIKFKKLFRDLVHVKDYSIVKNKISLKTLDERIKLDFDKKMLYKYYTNNTKLSSAKLVYKNNKFFIHIFVKTPYEKLRKEDINNIVGIDLGINFLAVLYDSKGKTEFIKGRSIKNKRRLFKKQREELSKVKTPSSRKKLKTLANKEKDYMNTINHTITSDIVNSHEKGTVFIVEDLKGITKNRKRINKKQRYYHSSWAFYDFIFMLEYKAKLNGQTVLKVDPKYTSQTCPKCGNIDKNNRDSKNHIFKCKNCKYSSNDDRIGAMNLYNKGLNYISNYKE